MTENDLPETSPETSYGLNHFDRNVTLQRFLKRYYSEFLEREQNNLSELAFFCAGELNNQADYNDRTAPPRLEYSLDCLHAPSRRVTRVLLNERYKDAQQELYRRGAIAKGFKKGPSNQPSREQIFAFLTQYLSSYTDISTGCPLAMSHPDALILAERAPENIRERFLGQFLRCDGRTMIGGTWATEWAGGSDVRGSTESRAELTDPETGECRVTGRNFFSSALGFESWGAIKTVRMPDGKNKDDLALVFIPRFTDEKWDAPEHEREENSVSFSYLKQKSGTRGLATGEVEMDKAQGWLVAPPGHGLRAMMQVLAGSRVHNAIASAGVMHRAYNDALCWVTRRETFGKKLITRPDIQADLTWLYVTWQGGLALSLEAVKAFDESLQNKENQLWQRVITALAKYWTAEKATQCTALATETIGGTAYTTDHPMERINRDAMVLRVWEGPKNIQSRELGQLLSAGASDLVIDRLEAVIAMLEHESIGSDKNGLKELITCLKSALENLTGNVDEDALLAQALMRTLSDIMAYGLLLAMAAQDLREYDDDTTLKTAQIFYNHASLKTPGLFDLPDVQRAPR